MTEFRAKTVSLLSGHKLKLLEEAGLTVVRSDDLDACHAEINKYREENARLKNVIDHIQAHAEGLRAELQSWEDAV